jgi:HK97 family phage major capsid protein
VPTVYENLIPRTMAREMIAMMPKQSAVLALGRRLTMPSGLTTIPVVSFLPVAAFTNPRYGGRKAATKVEWTAANVQAEELACTLALPNHFIDDAGYPVWEQVRPLIATAFAEALDMAVLFGTGAPAAFPAGGIAALAGAAQQDLAGAPQAIDKAAGVLEAQGITPSGIVASATIGTALRAAYRAAGALPGEAPAQVLYGWQVSQIADWDATKGDALVGDFNYLLVGLVEDIRFEMSDQAILQDATGVIIANAFQENLTAMKAWMRVGIAIGQPISTLTEVAAVPFEFADWTT